MNNSPRPVRPGLTFWLNLPPNWMVLDVESGRIPTQVAELIEAAEQRDPAISAHRGLIERQIRTVLRGARSHNLSFCAMLATVINDVLPMLATLTISLRTNPAGADPGAIVTDLERIAGAVVGPFDIPKAGSAVRARFRQTVDDASFQGPMEAAVCQYFVPTPRGLKVAVVTASTPLLPLEDEFANLFDAIMESFTFVGDDAVTPGSVR